MEIVPLDDELVIETRAAGRNPRQSLRIENLILAAPDLDFGVVRQRLVAEKFGPAFGRITVYINPEDSALGLAQTLMTGTRFGRLSYSELEPNDREIFAQIGNVDFINVSAVTDFPLPLSPTMPKTSPSSSAKDTPSTARTVPRGVGS